MSEHIRAIEKDVDHRPWPMPQLPWIMFQSWRNLLFAHWPVPWQALRALVPAELVLETYDGNAWVGLTPFRLAGLRPRCLPALPGLSEFPEMNLRTYVRVGEKPGIFFFSLDAASWPAVWGARTLYRLPYRHAEMRIQPRGGWIHYQCLRDGGAAEFAGRYRPTDSSFRAEPGTLEHFFIERYALYVVLRNGKILRGDIHHPVWSLQGAEAEIERNTMASAHGIILPEAAPVLHFAARQDTLVWPPVLVS